MAIGYHRPNVQETISYKPNDAGYRVINNVDTYVPAITDIMATIDRSDWHLLRHNNAFGNKYHFTGLTGGYWDNVSGDYKDVSGVVTTQILAFPSGYIIDHFTGLGWNDDRFPPDATFSDWWSPSRAELESIVEFDSADPLPPPRRKPFNLELAGITSSPYYANPTTQRYDVNAAGSFNGAKAYTASGADRYFRFHYT